MITEVPLHPYTSTTSLFRTLHGPSTSTASKLRRAARKRSGALHGKGGKVTGQYTDSIKN